MTRRFLARDPGAVSGLLRGQIQADDFIATRRVSAEAIVDQELTARPGIRMPEAVLASSVAQLSFTADPDAASVLAEARHAAAAGLVRPVTSLAGLFDLGPLNTLLRAAGRRPDQLRGPLEEPETVPLRGMAMAAGGGVHFRAGRPAW